MDEIDMIEYIQQEFKKRGFVTDPRGETYDRSLYNPETKVSVYVGNIGKVSAAIHVIDMINDGMNWGNAHSKLNLKSGTEIRFKFKTKTFDEFFNVTYQNRIKKLTQVLEN